MSLIAEIQRSQLITTYGIGSIYDALDYSVLIAGQELWKVKDTEIIHEERLKKKLCVEYFRQPKIIEDVGTIPGFRFPEWVFCPKCKSLKPIWKLSDRNEKKCAKCKEKYVPARFIVSCEHGHIDDFPWAWWVHKGSVCSKPKLKLHSTGKTTSLAGIRVSCENKDCLAERTLEGIFGKNALRGSRCRGRKPWLGIGVKEDCDETPRVLQRGSASVYYSVTESAISIPPFSERINLFLQQYDAELEFIPEAAFQGYFQQKLDQTGEDFRLEDVIQAAIKRKEKDPDDKPDKNIDLRQGEYEALCNPGPMDPRDEFAAEVGIVPSAYKNLISKIVLVHRLREVRALTGFTRIDPENNLAAISRSKTNWLPASEMRGEGIFLELNRKQMKEWVSQATQDFLKRINLLEIQRLKQLSENSSWAEKRVITPQFLLLHTLAHVLIQQLILDCGYSSSSLRERLYYNDGSDGRAEMSGLLIYTATPDSEGSLGGLVRQGYETRFRKVIYKALEQASWCSNDPLCMESEGQGHDSLNLAACHSCCLLPETSCELRNSYLDRGVLIGTGKGGNGFFSNP